MIRGILLGDFWGIEKNDWVELWAGLFGAIPAAVVSAVVAAVVAVFVLGQSNKHQRKLADGQMEQQRAEVSTSREKTAMAELIAAANKFAAFVVGNDPEVVKGMTTSFIGASLRWTLETGDGRHAKILAKCSSVLGGAGLAVSMTSGKSRDDLKSFHDTSTALLNEMVDVIMNFGLAWYLESSDDRPSFLKSFEADANRLEKELETLLGTLDRPSVS